MLNSSLKRQLERIEARINALALSMDKSRYREYLEYATDTKRMLKNSFLIGIVRGMGTAIGFTLLGALVVYVLQALAKSNLPIIADFISDIMEIVNTKKN